MIISFKNGEKVLTMENADMRSICGGTAVATQSFPCTLIKCLMTDFFKTFGKIHTF